MTGSAPGWWWDSETPGWYSEPHAEQTFRGERSASGGHHHTLAQSIDCEHALRFALITTHLGVPQTLASTAFIGAFADGLARIDVPVRVVALALVEAGCAAEAVAPTEVTTPWMTPKHPPLPEIVSAATLGILDDPASRIASYDGVTPDWYLELLLERDLRQFAGDEDLTVLFYLRMLPILNIVSRICARCGFKLVMQSSEALIDAQIDPSTREEFVERVVRSTDGTWALSEYLGEYWRSKGVPSDRVIVHPNVVRESSFRTEPAPRAASAVYIGNLSHREIEYLLEVSAVVHPQVPGYHLAIYGDATPQRRAELAGMIAERGLGSAVVLMEPVLPPQVPDVLATADVLLLPRSKGEFSTAGFPNKLGEYLSSGRPVVVTRVGDIPLYLTDGTSAFLVEPDDCEAFSAALVRVLNDADLADRVGAEGQAVARGLLASATVARKITDFVEGLPAPTPAPVAGSVRFSRAGRAVAEIRSAGLGWVRRRLGAVWRLGKRIVWRLRHTRSGHTRLVAFKMAVVSALQALGLRPPASKQ